MTGAGPDESSVPEGCITGAIPNFVVEAGGGPPNVGAEGIGVGAEFVGAGAGVAAATGIVAAATAAVAAAAPSPLLSAFAFSFFFFLPPRVLHLRNER